MSDTTIILRGSRRNPAFSIVDVNGAAIDMTVAGRAISLRLLKIGGSTASTFSPTWTSQSGGTGTFVLSTAATAALGTGQYWLTVWYTASADSEARRVYGPERWTVADDETGY